MNGLRALLASRTAWQLCMVCAIRVREQVPLSDICTYGYVKVFDQSSTAKPVPLRQTQPGERSSSICTGGLDFQ